MVNFCYFFLGDCSICLDAKNSTKKTVVVLSCEHSTLKSTINILITNTHFPHSRFDSKIIRFIPFVYELFPLQRENSTRSSKSNGEDNYFFFIVYIDI